MSTKDRRPLNEVAAEVRRTWKGAIPPNADAALDKLAQLSSVNDYFGSSQGVVILALFISYAVGHTFGKGLREELLAMLEEAAVEA